MFEMKENRLEAIEIKHQNCQAPFVSNGRDGSYVNL